MVQRLAAVMVLLVLAACTADEVDLRPCPAIILPADTSQQIHFQGPGRDLTDVIFEASIAAQGVECEYDEGTLETLLAVQLEAIRGPAAKVEEATLRYYVAVASSTGGILNREAFESVIALPGNQTRAALVEEIVPRIPLVGDSNGSAYSIYIGLIISEDEYRYNQQNR